VCPINFYKYNTIILRLLEMLALGVFSMNKPTNNSTLGEPGSYHFGLYALAEGLPGFLLYYSAFAFPFGAWLSLVEHLVRDQGVGGSNPLAPT
jgi:hypothetical protein